MKDGQSYQKENQDSSLSQSNGESRDLRKESDELQREARFKVLKISQNISAK